MAGMQQALMAAGFGAVVIPLPGGSVEGTSGVYSCSVTVNRNGTIELIDKNGVTTQNWYIPNRADVGDRYWVRFTKQSGDDLDGIWAGWKQLSSGYQAFYFFSSAVVPRSAVVLIEIAMDSGGVGVVTSGTYNFSFTA